MAVKIKGVILDPDKDNVAVALTVREAEETRNLKSGQVTLKEDIPYQYKFSIKHIRVAEKIIKVGEATSDIEPVYHVHIHNIKGHRPNKAVITGGDRPDIQLAAMETSTRCLILTGNIRPEAQIISRAEEEGIPILSTHHDTMTTIERIEGFFGKTRFTRRKN